MAVISEKYNYIFFANPQTASKAVAATLIAELDGQNLHDRMEPAEVKTLERRHHMNWQNVQDAGLLTAEQMEPMLKLTTVRNPYDLLVSRYLKRKERFTEEADKYKWVNRESKSRIIQSMDTATEKSFTEWVEIEFASKRKKNNPHKFGTARGQSNFLDHADFVIRFEHLQSDFDEFCARLGIDRKITVGKKNVTTQRLDEAAPEQEKKLHFSEFYDDATKAIVEKLYRPVIKRFKYECA